MAWSQVRCPLRDVRLLNTADLACSKSGRASTRFGVFILRAWALCRRVTSSRSGTCSTWGGRRWAKVQDVPRETYDADEHLRLALIYLVQVIGEAARQVSCEFTVTHAEIPWENIVGMRPNAAVQPRRLIIAPAPDGCKPPVRLP